MDVDGLSYGLKCRIVVSIHVAILSLSPSLGNMSLEDM
jgi:hypothetical protein